MMNFILKPSLEHIALVKVAATLWNQRDIRAEVVKFSNSSLFSRVEKEYFFLPPSHNERKQKWLQIEDKVTEKVSQLIITVCLKDKILGYIQAVGLQILRWMEFHRKIYRFDLGLPNEFCWTARGTVDKKKTAELLIRDDSIDITMRYKLACVYCLEDDILRLWNKMSENNRSFFYCEEDPSKVLQPKLVVFWTYTIKGEMDRIGSYQKALKYAACSSNKPATEYFLQKLNPRKKFLLKAALYVVNGLGEVDPRNKWLPKEYYADVLSFLFSQMSSMLQEKFFKEHPYQVLKRFLNWPLQSFFVETASHFLNFLPEAANFYIYLMSDIILKIIFGYKDCNYQKMLEEFWQRMPKTCKSCVINDVGVAGLVLNLIHIKDNRKKFDIFKLIFQDATLVEKNNLIFSTRGQYICKDLIEYDERDLFKFFVQLCITSKDEIIKLKQQFEEPMQLNITRQKWDEFARILDNFVNEYGKRKNEDEVDNNPAKKPCILNLKTST